MSVQSIKAGKAFVELGVNNKALLKGLKRAQARLGSFASSVGAIGAKMQFMGVAMAAPFAFAIKAMSDLEYELASLRGAANPTLEEFERIKKSITGVSEVTGAFEKDVAQAFSQLIKAGLPLEAVLQDVGRAAIEFAEVGALDFEKAAVIMTNAINLFGHEVGSAAGVIDLLSAAADASTTDIRSIAASFKTSATVFKLGNQNLEDLSVSIALMANSAQAAENAGTVLKTVMSRLTAPLTTAEGQFEKLNIQLRDAAGKMLPMETLVYNLSNAFKDLNDEARDRAFMDIFGGEGIRGAQVLFDKEGLDNFKKMKAAMKEALTVQEKYALLMQATKKQGDLLWASMNRVSIAVGSALADPLKTTYFLLRIVTEQMKKWVVENPKVIRVIAATAVGTMVLGSALLALALVIKLTAVAVGVLAIPFLILNNVMVVAKVMAGMLGAALLGLGKMAMVAAMLISSTLVRVVLLAKSSLVLLGSAVLYAKSSLILLGKAAVLVAAKVVAVLNIMTFGALNFAISFVTSMAVTTIAAISKFVVSMMLMAKATLVSLHITAFGAIKFATSFVTSMAVTTIAAISKFVVSMALMAKVVVVSLATMAVSAVMFAISFTASMMAAVVSGTLAWGVFALKILAVAGVLVSIGVIIAAVLAVISRSVGRFFTRLGSVITAAFKGIMQAVGNATGAIIDFVVSMINMVGEALTVFGEMVTSSLNASVTLAKGLSSNFVVVAKVMLSSYDAMSMAVGDLADATQLAYSKMVDAFKNGNIEAAIEILWTYLEFIWGAGVATLKMLWSSLYSTVLAAANAGWASIVDVAHSAYFAISDGWDRILTWMRNKLSGFVKVSKKIWNGLNASAQLNYIYIESAIKGRSAEDVATLERAVQSEYVARNAAADAEAGKTPEQRTAEMEERSAARLAKLSAALITNDEKLAAKLAEIEAANAVSLSEQLDAISDAKIKHKEAMDAINTDAPERSADTSFKKAQEELDKMLADLKAEMDATLKGAMGGAMDGAAQAKAMVESRGTFDTNTLGRMGFATKMEDAQKESNKYLKKISDKVTGMESFTFQ